MNDCDIPNKCPFCGEHTWCVNSRTFKRLPPTHTEEIIEIDEDGKVHGDISGLGVTPSGQAETSVNLPVATAGGVGIVTPEMLRDAEHEAGEDIPETDEQAHALYQRRATVLTRLLAAAGWAASGGQQCPICLGRTKVPAGFYSSVGSIWASTITAPETCRSCNGKGYLADAPAPAQLDIEAARELARNIMTDSQTVEELAAPRDFLVERIANALRRSQPAETKE